MKRRERMEIDRREDKWSFLWDIECNPKEKEDEVVWENGKEIMRLSLQGRSLTLLLYTYMKEKPLEFTIYLKYVRNRLEVRWLGYRVEIWNNGCLEEEDWPIGECMKGNEIEVKKLDWINLISIESPPLRIQNEEEQKEWERIQYWSPEDGRCNVGDCMPFFDGNRFHVFYLKDRHEHQSKWGLGAHQFAHISSDTLKRWKEHPLAVEISQQWEGSICTGSIIKEGTTYYIFYAVRMADRTKARITYAVSEDGIHFQKSGRYLTLSEPYETTSARDPEVFKGEDGKYHMLITTDNLYAETEERKGCLAHMVSDNLTDWKQCEPFLTPGYTDQPECSNYFKWNEWYYLVFSNYGFAKYRYSKQPFGPWIKPEQEILDGGFYRVPKTAGFFDNRRLLAGFLTKHSDGSGYGGHLVLRELVQKEDGRLGTKFIPECFQKTCQFNMKKEILSNEQESYTLKDLEFINGECYREFYMEHEKEAMEYGIIISNGEKNICEVRVEPYSKTVGIYAAHANPFDKNRSTTLYNVHMDKKIKMQLILRKGILDLCINEERTIISGIPYGKENTYKFHGFCKDGNVIFTIYG